jgi:Rieske Fe-S protein
MTDDSLPPPAGAASPLTSAGDRSPTRRSFVVWFGALVGTATGLLVGLPVMRFFSSPRRKTVDWVSLGPADSFAVGETRWTTFDNPRPGSPVGDSGVYVRRQPPGEDGADRFAVFAVYCPHRGCDVAWDPESAQFKCPCHGGVFDAEGNRVSGPPRRGLFCCAWRTHGDRLEIRAPHYDTCFELRADSSRTD